ncbi:MAG: hypothetical protein MJZ90_12140 [Bacteroidales bacterium]|nr:hypothetical protein [Bacteroidales bacterium]
MFPLVCSILSFCIAIAAFLYGIFRMKKGGPMCFLLFIFAVGCHSMRELWSIVNTLYYGMSQPNLSLLGTFGCLCFLCSANYGHLDSIVDEGDTSGRSACRQAMLAPAVAGALLAFFVVRSFLAGQTAKAVLMGLSFLPALPAAYFSAKHLLLPTDAMGFLDMTRRCNIAVLVYIAFSWACMMQSETTMLGSAFSVMLALSAAGLIYACKKGIELWEMLI